MVSLHPHPSGRRRPSTTGPLDAVVDAVHAHPALSQVVEEACKAAQAALLMEPAAQPA